MIFKRNTNKEVENNLAWKEKNKEYLNQLQKFLDSTDSIEREDLKNNVIAQMLKCDNILTKAAQKEIQKYKQKLHKIENKDT